MVATDGHRLAFVQASAADSGQVDQQFRALVPKKAMAELVKLDDDAGAEGKAIFAGDDNHLYFQVGHRLLIARKLTGNFPDYERVLPKDHQLSAKLQKDEIRSAIERVAQFADERSRAIRVQFTNGEVRVFSSSVEMGESEESVPSEYQGPDLEIGFNARYLLDITSQIEGKEVRFLLSDAGSPAIIEDAEDSRTLYVLMPLRV
jgi:DNA polymerase-3 subunit beta